MVSRHFVIVLVAAFFFINYLFKHLAYCFLAGKQVDQLLQLAALNLRLNFYLLWTFCPHLGSFCVFLFCFFSLCFGQISPLAFFR